MVDHNREHVASEAASQRGADTRLGGLEVVRSAREQFEALSGLVPESVSGLSRTTDGWQVLVDVVELQRVPRATDVLGSYEVHLDADGQIVGYERQGRYVRSATSQE